MTPIDHHCLDRDQTRSSSPRSSCRAGSQPTRCRLRRHHGRAAIFLSSPCCFCGSSATTSRIASGRVRFCCCSICVAASRGSVCAPFAVDRRRRRRRSGVHRRRPRRLLRALSRVARADAGAGSRSCLTECRLSSFSVSGSLLQFSWQRRCWADSAGFARTRRRSRAGATGVAGRAPVGGGRPERRSGDRRVGRQRRRRSCGRPLGNQHVSATQDLALRISRETLASSSISFSYSASHAGPGIDAFLQLQRLGLGFELAPASKQRCQLRVVGRCRQLRHRDTAGAPAHRPGPGASASRPTPSPLSSKTARSVVSCPRCS